MEVVFLRFFSWLDWLRGEIAVLRYKRILFLTLNFAIALQDEL